MSRVIRWLQNSRVNRRHTPVDPWWRLQNALFWDLAKAGVVCSAIAACVAVIVDAHAGINMVAGTGIALLPQVWFILRGFGRAAEGQAAVLAVGKFVLSGAGFALWFALAPGADLVATLGGTGLAIVTTAVFTVVTSRRPPTDNG